MIKHNIAAIIILFILSNQCCLAQQLPEEKMQAALTPLRQALSPLNNQAKAYYLLKDTAALKKLEPEMVGLYKQIDSIENAFVQQYPDAETSLDIVVRRGRSTQGLLVEPLFNSLSNRLRQSDKGQQLQTRFEALRKTR